MSLFSHSAQELPYPILEVCFNSHSGSHRSNRPSNSPFQNLKTYASLSNGPEQLSLTWDVINSGAQSLEAVSIENYGKFSVPPMALTLDRLVNLTYLSYSQRHIPWFTPENYDQNIGKLSQFLITKAPMKHLERIDLELQCHVAGVPDPSFDAETVAQWRHFDHVFSGPQYPALQYLFVKIFVEIILESISDDFDVNIFTDLATLELERCFVQLSTRDKTVFKVDVGASVEVV
ncbi:hypothetical protein JR316_0007870 [Psilocybe cubensis]|uniref:Uncharacterized protein n=2 Tax=Psilocybe cubensis TaxID=181762 RepID=A0ACB8GV12_PSICU|nr:hypothetical protein JR316_0007870 [Psilocybe cubensis]KAH9479282.1 hypothetical protein JR316_0007870 [Psilocybe cubensis]